MIQLSYMVEEIFPQRLARIIQIVEKSAQFCLHDVCTGKEKNCGKPLPEEMKQVRDYLIDNFVKVKKKE